MEYELVSTDHRNAVEYTLSVRQSKIPFDKGMHKTGTPEHRAAWADHVEGRMQDADVYAWFDARVDATFGKASGNAFLFGITRSNLEAFLGCSSYFAMQAEAYQDMIDHVKAAVCDSEMLRLQGHDVL